MDKNKIKKETKENKSREYLKIIEAFLVLIAISLVISLIYLKVLDREYAPYSREYNFDAYKVTTDENSITVSNYHSTGDRLRTDEIAYFENGKIVKKVTKYYYERLSIAKKEYNEDVKRISDNIEQGSQPSYTVEKEDNAVLHIYENPEFNFYYDDGSEATTEEELLNSFTTNEEIIKYLLPYIDKENSKYYKKVE